MKIVSVNVSGIREVMHKGKVVSTGIFKQPTSQAVQIETRGLVGDDQADKRHHGAPNQAVYAFSAQEYAYWNQTLGRTDFVFGLFGENLTVDGFDDSQVCLGDTFKVGQATLQATFPRQPCSTLAMAVKDPTFPKQFLARMRVGSYFQVLEPGSVKVGDSFEALQRHPAAISVVEAVKLMHFTDHSEAAAEAWKAAARVDSLDSGWREKFLQKAQA
jgi:MOSC domain-containing protein YiiM